MNTFAYQIVTGPATLALSDAEMLAHCRAAGQPEAQYQPYLAAAQAHVERITGRKLISQTWKWFLDGWPCGDRMQVPFGQLSSVTHIKYTDTEGTEATFSADYWEASTARDPGVIALSYGQSWPTATLRVLDPIEVQFVCGWANAAAVPEDIRSAIRLIAGHLFANRENVIVSNDGSVDSVAIEFGSRALLANWRLWL